MATKRRTSRFMFVFFAFSLMFSSLALIVPAAGASGTVKEVTKPACAWPPNQAGGAYNYLLTQGSPDCIDISYIDTSVACQLDGELIDYTSGLGSDFELLWIRESDVPAGGLLAIDWTKVGDFSAGPVVFENGGPSSTLDVRVFIGGPEEDYYVFANLGSYPYPYPKDPNAYSTVRYAWGGGVVHTISTDCPPPTEVQWCSPGYWKNNTAEWPVNVETTTVGTAFPNGLLDKGGNAVPTTTTLLYVLQNPKIFGGGTTELVADYLSGQHPGVYFTGERYNTGADGSLYEVCPLPGDGN